MSALLPSDTIVARPAESELEGCAWRCIGFQHPTFGGNVDAAPT